MFSLGKIFKDIEQLKDLWIFNVKKKEFGRNIIRWFIIIKIFIGFLEFLNFDEF